VLVQQAVGAGIPLRAMVADLFYGEHDAFTQGRHDLTLGYVLALKPSHPGCMWKIQRAARQVGTERTVRGQHALLPTAPVQAVAALARTIVVGSLMTLTRPAGVLLPSSIATSIQKLDHIHMQLRNIPLLPHPNLILHAPFHTL